MLSFYSYLVLLLTLLFHLYLAIHTCCLQKPTSLSTSYASKLKQPWCISVLEQVHVEANQHFCWKWNSWFYRQHLNTYSFRPMLLLNDETSKQTVPSKSTATTFLHLADAMGFEFEGLTSNPVNLDFVIVTYFSIFALVPATTIYSDASIFNCKGILTEEVVLPNDSLKIMIEFIGIVNIIYSARHP